MNKLRYIVVALACIQAMCLYTPSQSRSGNVQATVRVNEFSQVEGDRIFLGRIARIQAPPFMKDLLEAVDLGRSPKPGKTKILSVDRILSQIRSFQTTPEAIQLISPEKIYVKQASQELTQERVSNRVDQIVSDYFEGREFKVTRLHIQDTVPYPKGSLEMTIPSPIKVDKKGNLNFNLDILVDRKKEDTVRVKGRVAVYEAIVCAAGDLEKGSAVSEQDVLLIKKNIFSLRGAVVRDPQSLEGQQLKVGVKKDSPIRTDWLAPFPLVRKGEVVALVAEARHMKIVTSGIAREDGFKDKIIRVENLTSGKLVRGIVRQGATVEVIY